MTAIVSNRQFFLYTIGLFIFWLIVVASTASANTKLLEEDQKNIENCKGLCDQCDCLGFYCGEECICECNNNDSRNTECISRIQEIASKSKMPFEVLIQGPSRTNFIRNALEFEQKREKGHTMFPKKRATVTVYRPDFQIKPRLNGNSRLNAIDDEMKEKLIERPKRSTRSNQFEWFNDLSNNLLRPAPLEKNKKKHHQPVRTTSTEKPQAVKKTTGVDKSWFTDTIVSMLTPAPLTEHRPSRIYDKSLKSYQKDSEESEDDSEENQEQEVSKEEESEETPRHETSSMAPSISFLPKPKEVLKALNRDISNAFDLENWDKSKENDDDDDDDKNHSNDDDGDDEDDDDNESVQIKTKPIKKKMRSKQKGSSVMEKSKRKAFSQDMSKAFSFNMDKSKDDSEDEDNISNERKTKRKPKKKTKKNKYVDDSLESLENNDHNDYHNDEEDDDIDDADSNSGSKLEKTLEKSKKKRRTPKKSTKTFLGLRRKPFKRDEMDDHHTDDSDAEDLQFRPPWWKPVRLLKKVKYVLKS
ncbi:uncharacterized protein LOC142234844 [Haematobia irritans]|uniref:uncharacterized protein LOC142234844 n=1 Tax=Haematobia irritans TaxID=7368 RepID=UPI003F4F9846